MVSLGASPIYRMIIMLARVGAGHIHVADTGGQVIEVAAGWVDGHGIRGSLHPGVVGRIGYGTASAAAFQRHGNIRAVIPRRVGHMRRFELGQRLTILVVEKDFLAGLARGQSLGGQTIGVHMVAGVLADDDVLLHAGGQGG